MGTISSLSDKLELFESALRLSESRVKELVEVGRGKEVLMETMKRDWMEQERRTVEEHQQHERMLMENIHDLRMENKVVEREKEEMRTLVEETVKENRRFRARLDQVKGL